jgi:hypothetical protein
MSQPLQSPDGCEAGGNITVMLTISSPSGGAGGERINATEFGARSPFGGRRLSTGVTSMRANNANYSNWPGFRQPILEFNYFQTGVAPAFVPGVPERGQGAWFMDGSLAGSTTFPGFRTQATGHLGELVIHVLTSNPVANPPFAAPGLPVTATSNLMLNPADINFLLLTPGFDTLVGFLSNTVSEFIDDKDVADTVMPIGLAGPFGPPAINFFVQAFVVNTTTFSVVSTNVVQGHFY